MAEPRLSWKASVGPTQLLAPHPPVGPLRDGAQAVEVQLQLSHDPPPGIDAVARAALFVDRLEAVRRLAAGAGTPGGSVLLERRRDVAWLTVGGELHVVLEEEAAVAPILVTPSRCVVLAPVNEAARIADEELVGLPIEIEVLPWEQSDALADAARELAGATPMRAREVEPELLPLRSQLADPEHERMRWLGGRAGDALDRVRARIGPEGSMSEDDAVAILLDVLARAGVRAPVILAAADDRIRRYRHPLPRGRSIERRLMLVVVAERWGLHVAGTLVAERFPGSDEHAATDQAVDDVLAATLGASRAGTTLGDVFEVAQAAYARAGDRDAWRSHHQGGTIGYQGRERIATPGDTTILRAGMAVAWNPSLPGSKAEATAIVRADGPPEIILASRPRP